MDTQTAAESRQGRKFGIVLGGAFTVLALFLWWRGRSGFAVWIAAPAAVLLLGALVAPRLLLPVEAAWMRFAHAISRVTTPVFMAVIYFGVIMPVGLVARLFGHRPLRREPDRSAWVSRTARKSDLQRQF